MKKAHYDQEFYQDLFDLVIFRKRMDMLVWVGQFKEITHRIFGGVLQEVRAKNATCNTPACLSGHAAFLDPKVSGTMSEEGVIIGNRIYAWDEYSVRVFGRKYVDIVEIRNWNKFLYRIKPFNRLPKYKQAAIALALYVKEYFGYELDMPDDLEKMAIRVSYSY